MDQADFSRFIKGSLFGLIFAVILLILLFLLHPNIKIFSKYPLFSDAIIVFGFIFWCIGCASFLLGNMIKVKELIGWLKINLASIRFGLVSFLLSLIFILIFLFFVLSYFKAKRILDAFAESIAEIFGIDPLKLSIILVFSGLFSSLIFVLIEKFVIMKSS